MTRPYLPADRQLYDPQLLHSVRNACYVCRSGLRSPHSTSCIDPCTRMLPSGRSVHITVTSFAKIVYVCTRHGRTCGGASGPLVFRAQRRPGARGETARRPRRARPETSVFACGMAVRIRPKIRIMYNAVVHTHVAHALRQQAVVEGRRGASARGYDSLVVTLASSACPRIPGPPNSTLRASPPTS